VGDSFRISRTFTDDDVIRFAKISRDYNPVHFDARFAKARNFQAPICHGLLAASLVAAQKANFCVSPHLEVAAACLSAPHSSRFARRNLVFLRNCLIFYFLPVHQCVFRFPI
jgi:hypothetical protein